MGQISLVVTSRVHQRDAPGTLDERQVAYRSPSADIAPLLTKANAGGRITIRLGGFLELSVGDTGAIWAGPQPRETAPVRQAVRPALQQARRRDTVPMRTDRSSSAITRPNRCEFRSNKRFTGRRPRVLRALRPSQMNGGVSGTTTMYSDHHEPRQGTGHSAKAPARQQAL
jgi:hypothetical protein